MMQVDRSPVAAVPGSERLEPARLEPAGWSLGLEPLIAASGRSVRSSPPPASLAALVPGHGRRRGLRPRVRHELHVQHRPQYIGATAYWDAGYTGAGVDVAMIDTGVSPVEGLTTPGQGHQRPGPVARVAERRSPLPRHQRPRDVHGRHHRRQGRRAHDALQRGPRVRLPRHRARRPHRQRQGRRRRRRRRREPGHRGDRLGRPAPARQRPEHPRAEPVATARTRPSRTTVDPLAFAVEQAWKQGIFVVAATGNSGYVGKTGTLTNPAYDPKIFAVGASDSMGTATHGRRHGAGVLFHRQQRSYAGRRRAGHAHRRPPRPRVVRRPALRLDRAGQRPLLPRQRHERRGRRRRPARPRS